jgi:Glyoxalase-like domain
VKRQPTNRLTRLSAGECGRGFLIHLRHMIGGMALRLAQVNFKARDASALGRFWAEALGWGVFSERPGATAVGPVGFVWPDPVTVCIDVIAVPDPETVKDRVHLDLATTSEAHQAELVARLKDLGATPADVGQGDVPWTVLADPEGNVFCVLEPREIYRDTGPIAAVVVDCADPRAMARFWDEAMDWALDEVTDDHARLRSGKGVGPYLEFLRAPGARTMWNRVHLDVLPYPGDDQGAEVARLRALGATDADVGQGDVPWKVLADPEGNEFCVLAPH